jgi:hypothetical protein
MSDQNEYRLKHLEFIQSIISRQAQNSFAVKGWTLTLSAGIFTFLLSQSDANPAAYFIAVFPAFLFWLLDGYYLRQERAFRCLYDDVRADLTRTSEQEYLVQVFDMNTSRYKKIQPFFSAFRSKTVIGIPVMIFITSLVLFLIDLQS